MKPSNILLLPGWQNSDAAHWQSRWQARHGCQRVEQHDWMRPLRGDWSARLEDAVLAADGPVLLAAHSLGCILAAWWAAHSAHAQRVRAALLVAPGDVERPDLAELIPGWTPIARQPLPFRSLLAASSDDRYCSPGRARCLAQDWGARFVDCGALGHLNGESGLGDWDQAYDWLLQLTSPAPGADADTKAGP